MVPPMNQMKLSPLRCGQRPQNRMVEHFTAPESSLALRDDRIHCRNLHSDFTPHFLHRQTSRHSLFGSFSSFRQVTESQHHQPSPSACPLRELVRIPSPFRCRLDTNAPAPPPRTTYRRDANSSARSTYLLPLTPELASTLRARNPCSYLAFPRASGRMLRDNKIIPVITGRSP